LIEFVNGSTVQLVKTNASDEDVARAAWVSNYGDDARLREAGRIDGLINFLYRERHMSPFEHGSFTFFVDTPIFVAREFMRHRTWSYNETSGRYKELEPRFYMAPKDRPMQQKGKVGAYRFEPGTPEQTGEVYLRTMEAYEASWYSYESMLNKGVAKEVARNVLPVGTMTQFYATANPRNVMQFLQLRNDDNALKEIRDVAIAIEAEFARVMPLTYRAYQTYDWRDTDAELDRLRAEVQTLTTELAWRTDRGFVR
jgi:thymidylate synthase (FAD)